MKRREEKAIGRIFGSLALIARAEAPSEACGLVEWDGREMRLHHCRNASEEPETSFLIDPEDQVAVLLGIERRGTEVWAVFHSHATEGAKPSQRDRAFAANSPLRWVIVGLMPPDPEDEYEVWVGHP